MNCPLSATPRVWESPASREAAFLACFLHSLEEDGGSFLDSVGGAAAWLEKQLPKCALFPAAKLCVQKAIKFLPVLEAGLKKAKKAKAGPAGPKLSFSDDEEE